MRFPIHSKIAGISHENPDGSSRELIASTCEVGERLMLARDGANAYSRSAISVLRSNGQQLGFVSEILAEDLAPLLDSGGALFAVISGVTGGDDQWIGINIVIDQGETVPAKTGGMLHFTCANCGKSIHTAEENAGKKGRCPKCNAVMVVPSAEPPPIPPPIPPPLPTDEPQDEPEEQPIRGELVPAAPSTLAFPDINAYGNEPEDFASLANAIARVIAAGEYSTIAEAKFGKSRIVQAQKLLRLVKKTITAKVRAINAAFQNERIQVGKSVGSGVARVIFGAGAVGSYNAATKGDLRTQQMQAVAPYEDIKTQIDTLLLQMDGSKARIDNWIATQH